MATTKNGTYYPSNYDEVADVPMDMKKMAESIDKQLDSKVDKVEGKGLSTNDFTNEAKDKLDGLSNYDDSEIKQDIADIQGEQTTQDEEISSIKEVNTSQDELIAKLKNNQFNETAEGTSINVQDASDLPAVLEVSGGVRQATRKGTNLLDLNVTQNSKVTVNEDGTITINGTGGFSLNYKELTLKANITYYQKWELISGSATSTNGEIFMTLDSSKYSAKDKFTSISKTEDTIRSSLWINESAIFTNAVIKIWANTDQSDFEAYGATPSPEIPSEVEVVGDNINLFDKDNANVLNAYIGTSSKAITAGSYHRTIFIKVNSGETYTIKKHIDVNLIVGQTKEIPKIGDIVDSYIQNSSDLPSITQTILEGYNYLVAYIRNSEKYTEQEILDSIKIEQGPVATPYSPHGQGSIEITKANKNLYLKSNALKNGLWFVRGKVGNNGSGWFVVIPIKGGQTYTISRKYSVTSTNKLSFYISTTKEYPKNGVSFVNPWTNGEGTSYKLQASKEANYLFLGLAAISSFDITEEIKKMAVEELMVEVSDKKSEYTEGQQEVYNLSIQQPMLGKNEDTFVRENKNDFEVHGWEKVVLTGNENWSSQGTSSGLWCYFLIDDMYKTDSITGAYCNIATEKSSSEAYSSSTFCFATTASGNLAFKVPQYTQLSQWKEYLSQQNTTGNPVYVWYKLATPTKLPCTPEQVEVLEKLYNMPTYRPTTNIFTMQDLANLKLNYVADSKIYVDNKINDLTNQVNTINELLSTTETSSILLSNLQNDLESEVM